ncbi:MAG: TetR/AcrR family transcriptional regulator, partial [Spirochaetes bacterium]|nr:TetR/AcrR family transcriptional regulator [Spirochaetota bacterium]
FMVYSSMLLTKRLVTMKTSKDKIIHAAIIEFANYGLDGARVDRIAKKAKINKAMIYYHFKNKEALYAAIVKNLAQTIFDTVQGSLQKAIEAGNPIIVIEDYAKHMSSLDKHYFLIIMRELSSGGKFIRKIVAPTIIEPITELVGKFYQLGNNKNMLKDIHPQYTMISIAGAVIFYNLMRQILEGTSVYQKYFQESNVEQYIANLLQLLAHGIVKKE